jgi:hypothetical protein
MAPIFRSWAAAIAAIASPARNAAHSWSSSSALQEKPWRSGTPSALFRNHLSLPGFGQPQQLEMAPRRQFRSESNQERA